jgi:type IV fimbrial biogenesis protein FimT
MYRQHIRGMQRRARQFGVTLVESMVAVGLAGTLTAIGGPVLNQFRDKAAVDAQLRELESALHQARRVASSRGELVTICALDAQSAAAGDPECIASGKDWSAGWIVFVDRGERGSVGVGDKIISVRQAVAQGGSLVATTRYLTYRSTGVLLSIAAHFRALPPGQPAVDRPVPRSALLCVNKPGNSRAAAEAKCKG